MVDDLKYCPGLIHLRAALRKLIVATGATVIEVDDGGGDERETFTVDELGIIAASEHAAAVDDIVGYRVGSAVLQVIYDGPYSETSAAEIINDCNQRASEILDA